MTTARKHLIDKTSPLWVHCTSRCVRRAFLAGNRFEHRKSWIEGRLQYLSRCFAAEVAGYAVMSNHVHVIVRLDPSAPLGWSDLEVVRRWLSVYPRNYLSDGTPVLPSEAVIANTAKDTSRIGVWRKRLADHGWFMKAFKKPISRRAKHEDACTGAFWEGRFQSVPLLDQVALIACLAYIDLNPICAKISDRPKRSAFTSGFRRIRARNRHCAATRITRCEPQRAAKLLAKAGLAAHTKHPEDGLWLTPLARCQVGEPLGNKSITVDDYLTLLDATGRVLRSDKRGAIPAELAPIRSRLDLSVDAWIITMLGSRMFAFTSAIGTAASGVAQAGKRKLAWSRNRCSLFVDLSDAA